MGIPKCYISKNNEEAPKEVEGIHHDYGSVPAGTFL